MEYILIIVLQLLGIGFHVMQKISAIDKKFPEKSIKEVTGIFFDEDWNTLCISVLVLCLNIVGHYIVETYAPGFTENVWLTVPYQIWSFGFALFLGYAGQRFVYKAFGSAEVIINKQIENKTAT